MDLGILVNIEIEIIGIVFEVYLFIIFIYFFVDF